MKKEVQGLSVWGPPSSEVRSTGRQQLPGAREDAEWRGRTPSGGEGPRVAARHWDGRGHVSTGPGAAIHL